MKNYVKMMAKNNLCIGCGICENCFSNALNVQLDNNGKYTIELIDADINMDKFEALCPVISPGVLSNAFWGKVEKAYFGYSTNNEIRYRASSGGIISELLIYLLEKKEIEVVLHVGASKKNPFINEVYISQSAEEILKHAGSRYAPVKLLSSLDKILKNYSAIALVGKPCDIRAFCNYEKINPELCAKIKYKIAIICGGLPSQNATYRVVKQLGVDKENVIKFDYRGNGWPGLTVAIDKYNKKYTMEYTDSWGKILGRNIHKYCKFCPDGVGESADISCGDGWFGDNKGYPSHEEKDGRNIIVTRNSKGENLLQAANKDGFINITTIEDINKAFREIQPGQHYRKISLLGKVTAMRICFQYLPQFKMRQLIEWGKESSLKNEILVGLGTIKRLLKKSL